MEQKGTNTAEASDGTFEQSNRRDSLLSSDAERRRECRRCSGRALPGAALCEECYGRITEDLCTSQVLERFSP